MPAAPDRLASLRSFWTSADVRDPALWTYALTPTELDDLRSVTAALHGRAPSSLTAGDIPTIGALADASRRWREELQIGLGFLLVRGLDVDAFSPEALELSYVVMGLYFGTLVPQNLKGEVLTHVRDIGADPTLSSTRLYTTRAEQDFHTDGADVIGLLCRRTARAGGISRIASSGAIVAEIQRTRPDLYPQLFGDFPWHYQEAGQPAFWFTRPICTSPAMTDAGGLLNTFFIPWYIRRSQELPDAPRLTQAQSDVITLIEKLANAPRFYLDMTFEPGDIQWLKNAAILHKRTAYEDYDEPDRKRHLIRLWLRAPEFVDGDAQLRAGISRENVDGAARSSHRNDP